MRQSTFIYIFLYIYIFFFSIFSFFSYPPGVLSSLVLSISFVLVPAGLPFLLILWMHSDFPPACLLQLLFICFNVFPGRVATISTRRTPSPSPAPCSQPAWRTSSTLRTASAGVNSSTQSQVARTARCKARTGWRFLRTGFTKRTQSRFRTA